MIFIDMFATGLFFEFPAKIPLDPTFYNNTPQNSTLCNYIVCNNIVLVDYKVDISIDLDILTTLIYMIFYLHSFMHNHEPVQYITLKASLP